MQDTDKSSAIKSYWEQLYQSWPLTEVPWEEGMPCAELVDLVESRLVPKGRALDIGMGSGNNSVYLAKQGFTCYGIDIALTAVSYARDLAARARVSCEFILGDVTELPYRDQSFILVFDRGCFHSILPQERERFIEEVHRVLKPGGKYHLNCFSKKDHEEGISHTFSSEQLHSYFARLFKVHYIEERSHDGLGRTRYWLTALMERP